MPVFINFNLSSKYKNLSVNLKNMSLTKEKIDQIVKDIFIKYDTDKSGYLEKQEIFKMLEDSFKKMNKNEKV